MRLTSSMLCLFLSACLVGACSSSEEEEEGITERPTKDDGDAGTGGSSSGSAGKGGAAGTGGKSSAGAGGSGGTGTAGSGGTAGKGGASGAAGTGGASGTGGAGGDAGAGGAGGDAAGAGGKAGNGTGGAAGEAGGAGDGGTAGGGGDAGEGGQGGSSEGGTGGSMSGGSSGSSGAGGASGTGGSSGTGGTGGASGTGGSGGSGGTAPKCTDGYPTNGTFSGAFDLGDIGDNDSAKQASGKLAVGDTDWYKFAGKDNSNPVYKVNPNVSWTASQPTKVCLYGKCKNGDSWGSACSKGTAATSNGMNGCCADDGEVKLGSFSCSSGLFGDDAANMWVSVTRASGSATCTQYDLGAKFGTAVTGKPQPEDGSSPDAPPEEAP